MRAMMRDKPAGTMRRPSGWIFVLMMLAGDVVRGQDVSLLMNGQAAAAGTYKPSDVKSLVISGPDLSITFAKDANSDFSAISVLNNGTELAHNLHGGRGRGHLVVDTVKILKSSPQMAHFAAIDGGTNNPDYLESHFIMTQSARWNGLMYET
jgi:hypothetical protein